MSLEKHCTTRESSRGINTTPITGAWTDYLSSRPLSGKSDDISMSGYSVNSVVNKEKGVRDDTCSKRGKSEQYVNQGRTCKGIDISIKLTPQDLSPTKWTT